MSGAPAGRTRFWAVMLPLLLAAAGGAAYSGSFVGAAPAPRTHVVEIRGFQYHPATLSVAAGDTVVWVNRDVVPHTATAADGGWGSGSIVAGGSWRRVFAGAEAGSYTCTFHPGMTGRLTIR